MPEYSRTKFELPPVAMKLAKPLAQQREDLEHWLIDELGENDISR